MIITKEKINNIWCLVYRTNTPTDKWVILLHGLGQKGNPDGSQIYLVEDNAWGKVAAGLRPNGSTYGTVEFPFNMILPQIYSGGGGIYDYWQLIDNNTTSWFVNYVKETLKASKILVTGLSLGGRGTWKLFRYDTKNYVDAIAPVCGYYDTGGDGPINMANLGRSIPGYSWHGDKDTTMPYQWDADNIKAYNALTIRPTQVIDGVTQSCHYLKTLVGVDHTVWPYAYDLTPGKNSLYKWTLQQLQINTGSTTPPPTTGSTGTTVQSDVIKTYIAQDSTGAYYVYYQTNGKTYKQATPVNQTQTP